MSIVSATLLTAALLGVGPDGAISEHPTSEGPSSAEEAIQLLPNDEVEHASPHAISNSCQSSVVSCGASGCLTEPGAVFAGCQSNAVCNTQYGSNCENGGGGWCHWGDDDDCEPCCWDRHLMNYCIGPGDFYPHYPYLPVNHGYYYFRPYNFEHVYRDAEAAARMGGDPRAPYSVEFLRCYFPPAPVEEVTVSGMEPQLPLLEDLLKPETPVIPETSPTPLNPDTIPAPAPEQPKKPAEVLTPEVEESL